MKRVWMFAAVAVAALFCGGVDLKSALKQDKKAPERESVITADKIEFDNKEGVILLDNNVLVDDERFVLRSKRLLVFLDGTNDVKQILAVGTLPAPELHWLSVSNDRIISQDSNTITMTSGETYHYSKVINVLATAYTTEGMSWNITSTGTTARVGAIAVDPRVIPYNSRMYIVTDDGTIIYGIATAEDCGGLIKGNRVDLFFNTRYECIQFGARNCTIYILED